MKSIAIAGVCLIPLAGFIYDYLRSPFVAAGVAGVGLVLIFVAGAIACEQESAKQHEEYMENLKHVIGR